MYRQIIHQFTSIAILLLSCIPRFYCLRQNDYGYDSIQNIRRQLVEVKTIDSPNKIQVSIVNKNFRNYLAKQDNFLSTTIILDLYPIEYILDELQKKIFERSMKSFLKSMIASQTEYDIRILSATVTNMKASDIADSAASTRQMNKDQTLNVQTVIAAQQNLETTTLTQIEFSEYILNLCLLFKEDLMQMIKDKEVELIDNTDKGEVEKMIFHKLQRVDIALNLSKTAVKSRTSSSGLSKTGATVLVCFIILVASLTSILLFSHYRKSSNLHGGLKNYKTTSKLEDYLRKHECDDMTFAPYGEVQLIQYPRKKSRRSGRWGTKYHRYARMNEKDSSNDTDYEEELNFNERNIDKNETDTTTTASNFQGEEDYDDDVKETENDETQDDNIPVTYLEKWQEITDGSSHDNYYDDNRTVSSLGSSLTQQQLTTDGSLFMGECYAPPGKVGLAIDTKNGQPVIHQVRDNSPLVGVLRHLDVIVGIDDIDTSSMTAADITQLMNERIDKRKKITFLRGETAKKNLVEAAA